jgi:hypothetical protein
MIRNVTPILLVLSLTVIGCGTERASADALGPLGESETTDGATDASPKDSFPLTDAGGADTGTLWVEPTGERPQQTSVSSRALCICWPNGDSCAHFGEGSRPDDPSFRCPEGEVCLGGSENGYGDTSFSMCAKECWHPDATHRAELDCVDGDVCVVQRFKWGFEGQHSATQAYCVTRLPPGEPQPPSER